MTIKSASTDGTQRVHFVPDVTQGYMFANIFCDLKTQTPKVDGMRSTGDSTVSFIRYFKSLKSQGFVVKVLLVDAARFASSSSKRYETRLDTWSAYMLLLCHHHTKSFLSYLHRGELPSRRRTRTLLLFITNPPYVSVTHT